MRARGVTSSVFSHSRYGFLPSAVRYSRTSTSRTRYKLSHKIRIRCPSNVAKNERPVAEPSSMTTTRFGERNTYSGFELALSGQAVDVVEVGRVAATALWVARTH